MKNDITYDLLIIGGGISACVFASQYLKNNIKKRIALIEIGRGLGGRSSTRISKKYEGWKLNHGSPNFNISNTKNNLLLKRYIDELLKNKYIKIDDSEIIFLNEDSNLETIKKSELGLNPQIDGQLIRLPVPELNEERRNELKKLIKSMGEKCKISIRNIRRDANEELKKLLKSKEIGEDEEKSFEKNVQNITDKHIQIVDEKVSSKEKEIMTI